NSDDGSSAKRVWKLGDIVDSTPVAVSTPRERYDVIYGDTSYSAFYQRYRARRTVVYVGANDGMLHAFNGGFFTANDDPSTTAVEHGYFTTTPPSVISTTRAAPSLGAELWAFVPQELLPHLKWFTQNHDTHILQRVCGPRRDEPGKGPHHPVGLHGLDSWTQHQHAHLPSRESKHRCSNGQYERGLDGDLRERTDRLYRSQQSDREVLW